MSDELRNVLSNLTDTERRIVEVYMQRGGSAKEIASLLNVSERTVYKALYKYRKLALEQGIDPSNFYLRKTIAGTAAKPVQQGVPSELLESIKQELVSELAKIVEESVQRALKSMLEDLVVPRQDQRAPVEPVKPAVLEPHYDQVLYRLSDVLEKLNYNIERLAEKIDRLDSSGTAKAIAHEPYSWQAKPITTEVSMPSYVQGNPWLEILSRRQ
ncbi:helix-turn-helix transcriptional regulator [Thermofilum pendens]|uniref:Transcriptional regulator, RpiR family n=1 Tax=Thermofilum pendens (strain DSM 2475 / Hrk 5) TaxID=368408 RepID=A1RY33_THEPD|nr:sigma factor-like helix-turn-helix DNA-binding protein [Thermofilum pendens]ABL78113.1 putative transcriptional regulator, RpiR family [Thermofilum pendens Hrk 5]